MNIIRLDYNSTPGKHALCSLIPTILNPYQNFRGFTQHARAAFFTLPVDALFRLMEFRAEGNEMGYLLLKGLPQDGPFVDTPRTHDEAQQRRSFTSEYCLTMIGSHFGELYGFSQESNGAIFNNIRPTIHNQKQQSSESSDVFLELHTEIAFHEFRPDFLLLYCLRQDHHKMARTGVASIRSALPLLNIKILEELRKPNFSFSYDLSFGNKCGRNNSIKNMPILEGSLSDPYMTYDSDLIRPLNERAKAALVELDSALRKTMHQVVLEPGDIIIIDNRRTSHARTNFKAYYDGKDRWLQRVFVKQDLDSVRKRLPNQVPIIEDIL